ncbi:MAG: hypothetical protein H6707_15290 [Deltaproteobacteria bacterium]|nr:hypothetical protein [Deltaproteobacteria bacterium]
MRSLLLSGLILLSGAVGSAHAGQASAKRVRFKTLQSGTYSGARAQAILQTAQSVKSWRALGGATVADGSTGMYLVTRDVKDRGAQGFDQLEVRWTGDVVTVKRHEHRSKSLASGAALSWSTSAGADGGRMESLDLTSARGTRQLVREFRDGKLTTAVLRTQPKAGDGRIVSVIQNGNGMQERVWRQKERNFFQAQQVTLGKIRVWSIVHLGTPAVIVRPPKFPLLGNAPIVEYGAFYGRNNILYPSRVPVWMIERMPAETRAEVAELLIAAGMLLETEVPAQTFERWNTAAKRAGRLVRVRNLKAQTPPRLPMLLDGTL